MTFPKPSGEFEWTQESWGPALRCVPLQSVAPHCFTTRKLALTGSARDSAAAWTQLAAVVGVGLERLLRLRQVHGARVVEGTNDTLRAGLRGEWPEADAAVTCDPTVALAVRVADCVPVLIADPARTAVAAVHAGWRGTAAGATIAAVKAIDSTCSSRASDLVAAVGPSIGPCCYVVGQEMVAEFADHPEASSWFVRGETFRLDLWRATYDQLRRAGLADRNIHVSRLCTACHTDLFCSYRKEGTYPVMCVTD